MLQKKRKTTFPGSIQDFRQLLYKNFIIVMNRQAQSLHWGRTVPSTISIPSSCIESNFCNASGEIHRAIRLGNTHSIYFMRMLFTLSYWIDLGYHLLWNSTSNWRELNTKSPYALRKTFKLGNLYELRVKQASWACIYEFLSCVHVNLTGVNYEGPAADSLQTQPNLQHTCVMISYFPFGILWRTLIVIQSRDSSFFSHSPTGCSSLSLSHLHGHPSNLRELLFACWTGKFGWFNNQSSKNISRIIVAHRARHLRSFSSPLAVDMQNCDALRCFVHIMNVSIQESDNPDHTVSLADRSIFRLAYNLVQNMWI